jgi:glycolate oxidase FAD binding subunit
MPETVATWAVSLTRPGDSTQVIARLREAFVDPEVLAVMGPRLAGGESLLGWTLLLRYEGLEDEVEAAGEKTLGVIPSAEVWRMEEGQSTELWIKLRDFPAFKDNDPLPIVVRGQSIPSRTCRLAERWQGAGSLLCYPESGLVYVRTDDPEAYSSLLEMAQEQEGNAVLEVGPAQMKAQVDVFGEIPGGFELMKRIKEKLDPTGILSPGRFVGRL